MADIPFRLLVLQRLTALLEGTSGPDHQGNPISLVGQVFRGRTEFGDETTLPALSILESPNPALGVFAGEKEARAETWTLLLQGWAVDDKQNPSDPAYWLAAAVEKRLSLVTAERDDGSGRPADPDYFLLRHIITTLEVGPHVVRPIDAKTSSRAFFYLPLRIGLAQAVGQPYRSV